MLAGLALFTAWHQRAGCAVAHAHAPGGAGAVDLLLAHRLLPLTNLSALSTAAMFDAAPGISSAEGRGLVRLYQELYCR